MKYAIRAIKYFIYFSVLLVIVIFVLVQIKMVPADIQEIFRNGYDSIWQIALMFAGLSAVYPMFGYAKKSAAATGSIQERKAEIRQYMEDRGYTLASEEEGVLKFQRRNLFQRIFRMLEDTVTITQELGGFEFEGLRRDIVILAIGLETKINGGYEA